MKTRIAFIVSILIVIIILLRECQAPADLLDAAKEYDAMATLEFNLNTHFIEGVREIEFDYVPRVSSKNFKFRLYFPLIIGDTIDYYFDDLEEGILPFISGTQFEIYDNKNKLIYSSTYKLRDTVGVFRRPSAGISLGVKVPLKKNQLYKIKLTIPDNNITDKKLSKGQFIIGLGWSMAWP